MAWRAAESDEEAFRLAHSRAAALFPDNVDTEPPCVSKRVFRRPCNARSPAPNRDCQGADVITGIFNGAPDRHGGAAGGHGHYVQRFVNTVAYRNATQNRLLPHAA